MITVVTCVTSEKIYKENLKKTLDQQDTKFKLILGDISLDLFPAYNNIPKVDTKYILFIHQDINLLSSDWLRKAEEYCDSIENLGVAGVIGWDECSKADKGYMIASIRGQGNKVEYFGKTLRGKVLGKPFKKPIEVQVLDDMVLIVPTKVWRKIKFDTSNYTFHLTGFDYCLMLKEKGYKNYALPLQTFENSLTSWTKEYRKKHGSASSFLPPFKKKWKGKFRCGGKWRI